MLDRRLYFLWLLDFSSLKQLYDIFYLSMNLCEPCSNCCFNPFHIAIIFASKIEANTRLSVTAWMYVAPRSQIMNLPNGALDDQE